MSSEALSWPSQSDDNGHQEGGKGQRPELPSSLVLGVKEKRRALQRMKAWATGLLLGVAAVLVVARLQAGFWWGLVAAASEAAVVGAIADWFAVTALFRHPLGLPIPRTAIIPKNKKRIGEALGEFVQGHFLNAETVVEQVERFDAAERAGQWLNDPRNMRHVTEGVLSQAPAVLARLRDPRVTAFVQENVVDRLREADFKPVVQRVMEAFLRGDNPQTVVREVLAQVGQLLHTHQETLHVVLDRMVPRFFASIGVPGWVAGRARATLDAMIEDPHHPLRRQLVAAVLREARRQHYDEAARQWVDRLQLRVVYRSETAEVVRDVWDDLTAALTHDLERGPDSRVLAAIEDVASRLGREILLDREFQDAINEAIRDGAAKLARDQGAWVSQTISEKVGSWDETEVIENIELNVGPDLQYIRISGTLVGGLVGALIYLAYNLVFI